MFKAQALAIAFCGLLALGASALAEDANKGALPPEATWESIRGDIFRTSEFLDGEALMTLDMPYRAEDAAIVPISVSAKPESGIRKITVVIDENPAPMAASFTFGPAAAVASFSSRFRVNNYSWVHAVGETEDGKRYVVKKYIKASGGCSAPAGKDPDQALADIGKMKFRLFDATQEGAAQAPAGSGEAQIMMRHPNYSGLQMDQVSMLFIPARFVDLLEVKKGNDLVVKVEGGISLSEDPNIRFYYRNDAPGEFVADAQDTDQQKFHGVWPAKPDS